MEFDATGDLASYVDVFGADAGRWRSHNRAGAASMNSGLNRSALAAMVTLAAVGVVDVHRPPQLRGHLRVLGPRFSRITPRHLSRRKPRPPPALRPLQANRCGRFIEESA
jgi:hypothetical protein